jgi:hypothetical protein
MSDDEHPNFVGVGYRVVRDQVRAASRQKKSGSAAREGLGLPMNAALPTNLLDRAPAYVALKREMHDALRAQHPEWIEPNGDCPTCDSYESRLAQILSVSLAIERGSTFNK